MALLGIDSWITSYLAQIRFALETGTQYTSDNNILHLIPLQDMCPTVGLKFS